MAGTTTNYAFNYPTSTDLVKDGATAIQTLATNVDTTLFTALGGAYPGMRLVKTQAVGAGVSSVTVSSCFSSTYPNYRIIWSGGTSNAAGNNIGFTLSGTTASSMTYGLTFVSDAGTATNQGSSGTASYPCGLTGSTSNMLIIDLLQPFLAAPTMINSTCFSFGGGGYSHRGTGADTNSTSNTSFTFTRSTLSNGTIYVYGYGAS